MALKILLADDSMVAQNMGKKILTDAGYDVYVVSNGAAAVKKLPEINPDIIVVDVYMPGYTGLEVCSRVKSAPQTAQVPVLLTVGKMEPFRTEDGMRAMADGMIIKPFEASDLLAVVSKLAERVRAKSPVAPPPAAEPLTERQSVFEAAEVSAPRETPVEVAAAPAFAEDMVFADEPALPEAAAEVELPQAEPVIDMSPQTGPAPEAIFEIQGETPAVESAPAPEADRPESPECAPVSDTFPVTAPELEVATPAVMHAQEEPPEAALYAELSGDGVNYPMAETFQAFEIAAETPEPAPLIESRHTAVELEEPVEAESPLHAMAAAAPSSASVLAMPFSSPAPFGQTSPDDDVVAKALAAMLEGGKPAPLDGPAAHTLEAFAQSLGVAFETEATAAESPEAAAAVEVPPVEPVSPANELAQETTAVSVQDAPAPSGEELVTEPADAAIPDQPATAVHELPAQSPDATTHGDCDEPLPECTGTDAVVGAGDSSTDQDALATAIAERVLEGLKPQLIEAIAKELRSGR